MENIFSYESYLNSLWTIRNFLKNSLRKVWSRSNLDFQVPESRSSSGYRGKIQKVNINRAEIQRQKLQDDEIVEE